MFGFGQSIADAVLKILVNELNNSKSEVRAAFVSIFKQILDELGLTEKTKEEKPEDKPEAKKK